mmetsp:Transcript_10627/g.46036  ORF Transcript_10627/g.46036 Transcript_10627/m.46036 type:complete len:202 (+) Transcript_10627:2658-3263(+)
MVLRMVLRTTTTSGAWARRRCASPRSACATAPPRRRAPVTSSTRSPFAARRSRLTPREENRRFAERKFPERSGYVPTPRTITERSCGCSRGRPSEVRRETTVPILLEPFLETVGCQTRARASTSSRTSRRPKPRSANSSVPPPGIDPTTPRITTRPSGLCHPTSASPNARTERVACSERTFDARTERSRFVTTPTNPSQPF